MDGKDRSGSFADAVNDAAVAKRAQKAEDARRADARRADDAAATKDAQVKDKKDADAADEKKAAEKATDKADRKAADQSGTAATASEGTTSQDYVDAYGALVPADSAKQSKNADALSASADVKPEHEVSETLTKDGANLSAAAITVQLGQSDVTFDKKTTAASDGTVIATAPAKPGKGHLLPIDELKALIDGKTPAQQTTDTAVADATVAGADGKAVKEAAQALADAQKQAGQATADAAKTAAAQHTDKADKTDAKTAVADTAATVTAAQAGAQGAETEATDILTAATEGATAGQADGATGDAASADTATAATAAATDGAKLAKTDETDALTTKQPLALADDKALSAEAKAQAAAAHAAQQAASQHVSHAAVAHAAKQAAEGHTAATTAAQQQPAAQAVAQAAAKAVGADVTDGKQADAADFKALLQPANTQAVGQQFTARAIDPTAGLGQQMAGSAGRDPSLALTPEQLVGQSAGSSHDAVAAGLNNLRGQSSFLDSMGLMGGRPSATLSANVAQQFNLQVSKAVLKGEQQFTMRLDPAELGRVEVKLHFTKDGEIRAKVAAERPETLHLLQRDAKGLEKALTSHGQRVEQGGISFSLDNSGEQSAGRAFAEAVQQEKMRADLAARSAAPIGADFTTDTAEQQVPLENILPHVSAETGVDISV